jgi:hypothetical protein
LAARIFSPATVLKIRTFYAQLTEAEVETLARALIAAGGVIQETTAYLAKRPNGRSKTGLPSGSRTARTTSRSLNAVARAQMLFAETARRVGPGDSPQLLPAR